MARKPRVYSESGIYHVILRGNNKQNLFHDDNDRVCFLKRLNKYSHQLKIHVYAYCLMTNHVHILLGQAGENLSLLIQKLANSYVYYFNHKYDRCGHLFQGRFKSEAITDDDYFKTVYRYIMHNSEKAGLEDYKKYKWNSYQVLKQNRSKYIFIETRYVINLFEKKELLLKFLSEKSDQTCMEYEDKFVFTDDKAFTFIKKIFGISSPYKLERLDIDEQIAKCKILRENGLSISQITRITGISRKIIKMA